MIVAKLKGGLGNQMFQYALGRSLSINNNTSLILDSCALEDKTQPHIYRRFELGNFNINAIVQNGSFLTTQRKTISKIYFLLDFINKTKRLDFIPEKQFPYDDKITKLTDNVYIDGYWNSPKYFNQIAEVIKKDFTFKQTLNTKNLKTAIHIQSCLSVSLHVRRGDYISNPETNAFHGTCNASYYEKAIHLICEKHPSAIFFIFSDDPIWVSENLKIDAEHYIISKQEESNAIQEMHLMTLCKHSIIANSTFSWWAAWLINNSEKVVIAPYNWFKNSNINTDDLFPSSWIRI